MSDPRHDQFCKKMAALVQEYAPGALRGEPIGTSDAVTALALTAGGILAAVRIHGTRERAAAVHAVLTADVEKNYVGILQNFVRSRGAT